MPAPIDVRESDYADYIAWLALVAARAGGGSGGVPGFPAFNPGWYAKTAIYWDPAGTHGGNDSNSGDIGFPVLTWLEIVRRYGSSSPQFNYGQTVTIHKLSAQPVNQDPVFFTPKLSGGGKAVLIDTPTIVQTAFAAGGITAPNKISGGTPWTIASMPGGTVAGQLVFNVTRNSYAFIDSMSGSTANMCQPLTAASSTVPGANAIVSDNSWTTGDSITISQCTNLNLKQWCPIGSDFAPGGGASSASVGWVQFSRMPDTSGVGSSSYAHIANGGNNYLSFCQVDCILKNSSVSSFTSGLIGCFVSGLSNAIVGQNLIFSGTFLQGFFQISGDMRINNAPIARSGLNMSNGRCVISSEGLFCSTNVSVTVNNGELSLGGVIWGALTVTCQPNGVCQNISGSNWVTIWQLPTFATMGLGISSSTTGTSYAAGVLTDGITINPTNLDANNGALMNVRINARFCLPS